MSYIAEGFDRMLAEYSKARITHTAEQRMNINRECLQATHFTRDELEEMLVVAIERLTA
jgi:hypothetical protein